ncbi:MAG: urea ABC transporter ATP-binding subunit UrtE [Geminicoccaceae bacterium]|nr:urea ABC transporter ATP-binding subunit UrtE [Geminicoccaceae bacterium]MCX7628773.1 urea ABC transporter ATP-binding subunit UrtE [Geminicoccaceae bacterium]MDW8123379.1 urea ABC transporter ATP-binding subunit UrtE [Geminicoccaceae bacterium]
MLDVRDVHLHYGASHALRGVSLTVERGAITCLLGRNGVGKTTLLKAILGLEPTSGGTIRLEGRALDGLPAWKRARLGLAAVPQGREIFPRLTVEENLLTGHAALRGRGQEPLPLEEIYARFPILRSMARRRGGDLSGGQQQQLAIGRALVTRPKVLLLDEPTEGIQPNIVAEIGRVIEELAREGSMAILLVEQYLDFALELADRILIMDRGRIVLEGDRATLDLDAARRFLTV